MTEMMIQEHWFRAGGSVDLPGEMALEKGELLPFLSHSRGAPFALHPTELWRPQHRSESQGSPPADLPIFPGHRDCIDVAEPQTCLTETVANRLHRQGRDMLDPDEPFFFCRSNDSAVLDQRRRGIPHVRQTQYPHRSRAPSHSMPSVWSAG